MKVGINEPYLSGTNRDRLLEWFRGVDQGPFDAICTGERAPSSDSAMQPPVTSAFIALSNDLGELDRLEAALDDAR